MERRDLIMLASGVIAGSILTGVASYFFIYRRYVPLNKLDKEIEEATAKRKQLCDDCNTIMTENKKLLKHFREKEDEMDERLRFYEDELDRTNKDIAEAKIQLDEAKTKTNYAGIKSAPCYTSSTGDPAHDEEVEVYDVDDDQEESELCDDPQPYIITEDYLKVPGNPRLDGPLTEEELEKLELCQSENERLTEIDSIIESRFDDTIDEDDRTYVITDKEHEDAPWFIDTEELEYYEADDILAQDGAVVPSFDELITPIALNHFGPNSQSGDPNVVWCRNDVLKIDYQITRFEGSYQHYVLGIPEDRAYDPPHKFNKERAAAMEETYDDNRGRN